MFSYCGYCKVNICITSVLGKVIKSEAYSGFCPGGGLKILPGGQKYFWVSPPLEQFEPPPELLKLT